jgi:hypothetical protein
METPSKDPLPYEQKARLSNYYALLEKVMNMDKKVMVWWKKGKAPIFLRDSGRGSRNPS